MEGIKRLALLAYGQHLPYRGCRQSAFPDYTERSTRIYRWLFESIAAGVTQTSHSHPLPPKLIKVPDCRKLASICNETLPTFSGLQGTQRNMESNAGFIIKVLIASTAISVAIKYVGTITAIPPAPKLALIAVLLPTIIMAVALLWRSWQQKSEG